MQQQQFCLVENMGTRCTTITGQGKKVLIDTAFFTLRMRPHFPPALQVESRERCEFSTAVHYVPNIFFHKNNRLIWWVHAFFSSYTTRTEKYFVLQLYCCTIQKSHTLRQCTVLCSRERARESSLLLLYISYDLRSGKQF